MNADPAWISEARATAEALVLFREITSALLLHGDGKFLMDASVEDVANALEPEGIVI